MHFGAALFGVADDLERRDFDAVLHLEHAIDGVPAVELHEVLLAVAADGEAQPLGERVDAGDADAVQAAGDFVRVLVELSAGVQHAHHDFGRRTARLVLVVELDAGRNAAAVVGHRDRVVGVDGDHDVVAMPGQRLVDRVIHDLEDHVVQAGAIGGVADVHPRPLAHSLQAFQLLNARFVVGRLAVQFTHARSELCSR